MSSTQGNVATIGQGHTRACVSLEYTGWARTTGACPLAEHLRRHWRPVREPLRPAVDDVKHPAVLAAVAGRAWVQCFRRTLVVCSWVEAGILALGPASKRPAMSVAVSSGSLTGPRAQALAYRHMQR